MSVRSPHLIYSPLDRHQRTIRLIELHPGHIHAPIQCEIKHANLSESPHYVAVSYAWGHKCRSELQIWVNSRLCYARPSLWAMLQALRDPLEPRTLWIDALCINQNNKLERNHQVGMMGIIYTQADHVIVWLGRSQDNSDTAFDFMNNLRPSEEISSEIDHNFGPDNEASDAFALLCHRDYWYRAWIRPEIILARRVELWCGGRNTAWETFARCSDLMAEQLKTSPVPFLVSQQKLDRDQKKQPLNELIKKFGSSQATDCRDKIFALLGLASDYGGGHSIEADYSLTPADLLQRILANYSFKQDFEFESLVANMLLPSQEYQQRLEEVELLSKTFIHANDVQLRLNSRSLHVLASDYTTMIDPENYLAIKSRVVWKIIATHHPREPSLFVTIFQGLSGLDRAPVAELDRAKMLQAALDMRGSFLRNRGHMETIYSAIDAICSKLATGSQDIIGTVRKSTQQVYWNLIIAHWVAANNREWLSEFGCKLDRVFELEETNRVETTHQYLVGIRNRYRHLEILRVVGSTTGCGCKFPGRYATGIKCPLDRFGIFWIILMSLWPRAMSRNVLNTQQEDLLQRASTLHTRSPGRVRVVDEYSRLKLILLSSASGDELETKSHRRDHVDWWNGLRKRCKALSHHNLIRRSGLATPAEMLKEVAHGSPTLNKVISSGQYIDFSAVSSDGDDATRRWSPIAWVQDLNVNKQNLHEPILSIYSPIEGPLERRIRRNVRSFAPSSNAMVNAPMAAILGPSLIFRRIEDESEISYPVRGMPSRFPRPDVRDTE